MKLAIYSDLHEEFGSTFVPPKLDVDAVILAGDTHLKTKGIKWAKETFNDIPVYYVAGNHEFYGENFSFLYQKLALEAANSNIYFLEQTFEELCGIRILGCTLWTDFKITGNQPLAMVEAQQRMNDYARIRYGNEYRRLYSRDTLQYHIKSRKWLETELQRDPEVPKIVITHHIPVTLKCLSLIDAAYCSSLEHLIFKYKPRCWIYGHDHKAYQGMIDETLLVSNPRGYPGEITGWNSNLIVEV